MFQDLDVFVCACFFLNVAIRRRNNPTLSLKMS